MTDQTIQNNGNSLPDNSETITEKLFRQSREAFIQSTVDSLILEIADLETAFLNQKLNGSMALSESDKAQWAQLVEANNCYVQKIQQVIQL